MEQPDPPKLQRMNWLSVSFQSGARRSAKYRADIDGLRAVAVLAVLLFHAGFDQLRSGFVGVDIFYVISGFLITSLLVEDLERGRFSVVSFYERRLRRIFPALFAVLLFCIIAASVLLDPHEMLAFGKSLLAATFFVSNFYFWHSARPAGYFDAATIKPLLHTWSLSVEEQFYLLFPITLFALFRWARAHIKAWLVLLTAVSFGLNLWMTSHRPVAAFYWSVPRAWELLLGALLALEAFPALERRAAREFAGVTGMGMIVYAIALLPHEAPFPGWAALPPCVGACLVIYAGQKGACSAQTILSFHPLVFIGAISYSLYLWHWPIIEFSRHLPFQFSRNQQTAIALLGSIAAAFVSFEFIERPFRGSTSVFSRGQIFAFGLAASMATAGVGAAAYLSRGLPQRYDPETRMLVAENLSRSQDFDGSCSNFKTEVHRLSDIKTCSYGGASTQKIMFWGDSHVEQLYPVAQSLYRGGKLGGRGFLFMIGSGCLPDENLNNGEAGFHCDAFTRYAMQRAQDAEVQTVYMGFSSGLLLADDRACLASNGACQQLLLRGEAVHRFLFDLSNEIHTLKAQGKNVVLGLPFPIYDQSIPPLEVSNAVFGRFGVTITPRDTTSPELIKSIREVAAKEGATTFDPRLTLCPQGRCQFAVNGVSLYWDQSHLANSQALILADSLRQALTAAQ